MGTPQAYQPTSDIREAYNRCDPVAPLRGDQLCYWYVDCSEARGVPGLIDRLAARIELPEGFRPGSSAPMTFGRALLSGHRGCGKSTELQNLKARLGQAGYWPLVVEAHTQVAPDNLDTEAVILVVMTSLVEALAAQDVALGEKKLADITRWFGDARIEYKDVIEAAAEAGAEGGLSVAAFIASLKATFKVYTKQASTQAQTETVQQRKYLSELRGHLDDLLADAHLKLQKSTNKQPQIVLIVDGLDRIEEQALQHEVFITYRDLLHGLQAHTVFTVPIDLVCSATSAVLRDTFGPVECMPSVQVENPQGLQAAREIVTRRCAEDVFAPGVIDFICRASGGDVRHILMLVREAIVHSRVQAPVSLEGARSALAAMTRAFSDWLQPGDYDALVDHHLDPKDEQGRIAQPESGRLLLSSALLCYSNGGNWYRVHPAICGLPDDGVRALPQFQTRLEAKGKGAEVDEHLSDD